MSKKDYKKFAALLKQKLSEQMAEDNADMYVSMKILIQEVADIFAEDNPNFSRQRFYDACGLSDMEA